MIVLDVLFAILFYLSIIAFILGIINPKWIGLKTRKKSILVTLVATIVFLVAFGITAPEVDESADENEDKQEQIDQEEKEQAEKKKADEEIAKKEATNEETPKEDELTWDDVKTKDKIVGKSDKDYSELTNSKSSKVRNDKTGNWRKSTIAENVDIEEYILSYSDLHMDEDEVHFIINFNYNTTTWITEMHSLLYVDIREYVEKEEHDAKTLGNGMTLISYVIYPDGDIEEIEY